MSARIRLERKLRLGSYTLLGRPLFGGIGQVWRARADTGEVYAVKCARFTGNRAERALDDEIEILTRLRGRDGIVQIIDSGRSPVAGRWYAMEWLEPITSAYPGTPAVERVLRIGSRIAEILAQLSDESIRHRDLKPSNLLSRAGEPVVTDFGIAAFPGRVAQTVRGEKLGPLHFIAPEMMEVADAPDYDRSDVYSLAKTLWCLATESRYPPPGLQPANQASTALRERYADQRKAAMLDSVIEACTRHDPAARPTLREMAQELAAILNQPAFNHSGSMEDISELLARIRATEEPRTSLDALRQRYHSAWERAHSVGELEVQPLRDWLRTMLSVSVSPLSIANDSTYANFVRLPHPPVAAGTVGFTVRGTFASLDAGVEFIIDQNGRLHATAFAWIHQETLFVNNTHSGTEDFWRWSHPAEPVLAEGERVRATFAEQGALLRERMPDFLEQFARAGETHPASRGLFGG